MKYLAVIGLMFAFIALFAVQGSFAQSPTEEPTGTTEATAVATTEVEPTTNAVISPLTIEPGEPVGFLRFAHTGTDVGPVDIYLVEDETLLVSNLAYGEFTDYVAVPTSRQGFIVRETGSAEDMFTLAWGVAENASWLITTAGVEEQANFLLEPISVVRSGLNGQAQVRVINFVYGDFFSVTSNSGIDFAPAPLDYFGIADTTVDPGSYTLDFVNDAGEIEHTLEATFEADTVYTLIIVGAPDGEPATDVLNLVSPQDVTRVRFLNQSDEVVDIHYRPAEELLVGNFAAQSEGEFIELPSGSATFLVYAPGTSSPELASLPVQLTPWHDVTIVINADGTLSAQEQILTVGEPHEVSQ